MKTLTNKQLREAVKPIWYQDKIYVTQQFWNFNIMYNGTDNRHIGLDTRVHNRMFGDKLYAQFRGTIVKIGYFNLIGWGIELLSDAYTVDGVTFKIKAVYLHIRKPSIKEGARVEQGDLIGRTGIFLAGPTPFWTAPHTHNEIIPFYRDPITRTFKQDWSKKYSRIDPVDFVDGSVKDYERRDIKTPFEPFVFYLENGKKRYYEDEYVYTSHGRIFSRDCDNISEALMDKIPRGDAMPFNKTSEAGRAVIQLSGLLVNNHSRSIKLDNKHINN